MIIELGLASEATKGFGAPFLEVSMGGSPCLPARGAPMPGIPGCY